MRNVIEVSDDTFAKEVYESDIPVLVDFWAPWCGPCRMLTPVLEEIASELKGKIKIVKLNLDENPMQSSNFNIRSVPNLILFKGKDIVEQMAGALPKPKLIEFIEKAF